MAIETPEFISVLQELRGTSGPGETMVDGMYWDMTINTENDTREGDGIYGAILSMYADFIVGPIIKSPNGTAYKIVVDNSGNLSTVVA